MTNTSSLPTELKEDSAVITQDLIVKSFNPLASGTPNLTYQDIYPSLKMAHASIHSIDTLKNIKDLFLNDPDGWLKYINIIYNRIQKSKQEGVFFHLYYQFKEKYPIKFYYPYGNTPPQDNELNALGIQGVRIDSFLFDTTRFNKLTPRKMIKTFVYSGKFKIYHEDTNPRRWEILQGNMYNVEIAFYPQHAIEYYNYKHYPSHESIFSMLSNVYLNTEQLSDKTVEAIAKKIADKIFIPIEVSPILKYQTVDIVVTGTVSQVLDRLIQDLDAIWDWGQYSQFNVPHIFIAPKEEFLTSFVCCDDFES